jgi:hypothetical protein
MSVVYIFINSLRFPGLSELRRSSENTLKQLNILKNEKEAF